MNDYLNSVIKQFDYYKSLAEKTFEQLPEDKLFWKYNNESNSIGMTERPSAIGLHLRMMSLPR
jgi:hypothetical protein